MQVYLYDDGLPPQAAAIRRAVFMDEQGFRDEFDEIDPRASHLVLCDREVPIATGRFYRAPGCDTYLVGRIAWSRPIAGRASGPRCCAPPSGLCGSGRAAASPCMLRCRPGRFMRSWVTRPTAPSSWRSIARISGWKRHCDAGVIPAGRPDKKSPRGARAPGAWFGAGDYRR